MTSYNVCGKEEGGWQSKLGAEAAVARENRTTSVEKCNALTVVKSRDVQKTKRDVYVRLLNKRS